MTEPRAAADKVATDFFYLTGFNEPDATLVLGMSCYMTN